MKFVAIAAVLALASHSTARGQADPAYKWKGKKMPAFSMKLSSGGTVNNASIKGKVVVIDFWATWCNPCKTMSAILGQIHGFYAKKGLLTYGADTGEMRDGAIEKWLIFNTPHYPITLKNEELANRLQVTGLPTVLIIDRKGVIRLVQSGIGRDTPQLLDQTVRKLLAEKP